MSPSSHALATSPSAPSTSDEQSGVRRIPALDDARALWEQEDLRMIEQAAELVMFEWHMFLTELEPAVATPDASPVDEPPAKTPVANRRRAIWLWAGALYAAVIAIAATPTGADAFASALTAGHGDQVRHAVHEMTAFLR